MDFRHKNTLAVPESARRCKKCNEDHPIEYFTWAKKDKYRGWTCYSCISEYKRVWRRERGLVKNPEKNRRRKGEGMKSYEGHLSRKYDLSWDDYQALLQKFDNKCYICGIEVDLVVDHSHLNGKVRGILCRNHNSALGFLNDDLNYITKLYFYLLEHNEFST